MAMLATTPRLCHRSRSIPDRLGRARHRTRTGAEREVSFFAPNHLAEIERLLPDLAGQRLKGMNEAGIEITVLSQTAPGVQNIQSTSEAVDCARAANNHLKPSFDLHPDRFSGFASLALQDVAAACDELTRCVKELGSPPTTPRKTSAWRDTGFRERQPAPGPLATHPPRSASGPTLVLAGKSNTLSNSGP